MYTMPHYKTVNYLLQESSEEGDFLHVQGAGYLWHLASVQEDLPWVNHALTDMISQTDTDLVRFKSCATRMIQFIIGKRYRVASDSEVVTRKINISSLYEIATLLAPAKRCKNSILIAVLENSNCIV